MTRAFLILALLAAACFAGNWSKPAVVTHDDAPAITYRARLAGAYLTVEASLAPGWHTFVLDNKERAAEKLGGRKALSQDKPTEVRFTQGLTPEAGAGWVQSAPKDFSQPDIRLYSWGFEGKALMMTKVKPDAAAGVAKLDVRGQACTPAVCKNVNVELEVPLQPAAGEAKAASAAAAQWRTLTPARLAVSSPPSE